MTVNRKRDSGKGLGMVRQVCVASPQGELQISCINVYILKVLI